MSQKVGLLENSYLKRALVLTVIIDGVIFCNIDEMFQDSYLIFYLLLTQFITYYNMETEKLTLFYLFLIHSFSSLSKHGSGLAKQSN